MKIEELIEDELSHLENEYILKNNKRKKIRLITLISTTLLYTVIVFFVLSKDSYTPKIDIHNKIIMAINNEATLDVIKNIYQNREVLGKLTTFFKSKNNYYNYNVSLSHILDDVKMEYYLTKNYTPVATLKTT